MHCIGDRGTRHANVCLDGPRCSKKLRGQFGFEIVGECSDGSTVCAVINHVFAKPRADAAAFAFEHNRVDR